MAIKIGTYLGLLTVILVCITSCRRDTNFITGAANLEYSTDTILFDTVFTELGSATRSVKIKNLESDPVKVQISLGQPEGFFRISADALQGREELEVEILSGDSIYVFVEVTIDPDMPLSISPFVVEDVLLVQSGDRVDEVKLIAWGQNANYVPSRTAAGGIALLSCDLQDVIWDDPKPYVVYGVLLIDSCNLILPPGTNVFVHGGVVQAEGGGLYNDGQIITLPSGRITSQGTVEQPVKFEGDRLESDFNDVPGQWGGVRMAVGSRGSQFTHTLFRNGVVGIFADSTAEVSLDACRFENSSAGAIIGSHAEISAVNCLAYSAGSSALQLVYGGTYSFDYCTFYSINNQSPTILLRNYRCPDFPICQEGFFVNPIIVDISNSIIAGPAEDEIILDDGTMDDGDFTYFFNNTIVRVNDLLDSDNEPLFFENCENCYNLMSSDTLFVDSDDFDLRLDTVSVARGRGLFDPEVPEDLVGFPRDNLTPDIGCYEFQE